MSPNSFRTCPSVINLWLWTISRNAARRRSSSCSAPPRSNRQNVLFNNLGVFRHNDPGVIWGDFDMRLLKLQTGPPGNLVTVLDMPLIENALDLSVNANHGTTFNMDLPSG